MDEREDALKGDKNDHQNQFEQISAIVPNHESATNFQHDIDLSIGDEDIQKFSQFTDKFSYYKKLCYQNKQMYNQLKQFDAKLNQQIKQISIHKQKQASKDKYKLYTKRSELVMNKYKQLDLCKIQLKEKQRHKNSLEALKQKIEQLKSKYKEKYIQLQLKQKNLAKLKNLLHKNQLQESKLTNNSMMFEDVYKTEIKELKQKIKQKTVKIYEQKQKYIQSAKNKPKKQNTSAANLQIKNQDTIQQSPALLELRIKYQTIGHRIQLLKMRKKVLSQSQGGLSQRKKYLLKLKSKLMELTKL